MKSASVFLAVFAFAGAAAADVPPPPGPPRAASVLLAYDGTGDFGPQTPGTRTDGWQEALDH